MSASGRGATSDIGKLHTWQRTGAVDDLATLPSDDMFSGRQTPGFPMHSNPGISVVDSNARAAQSEAGSPRSVQMQVKQSACWQDWEKHSMDWEMILRDSPELTIFSTPEWLGAWWKAFGQDKRMMAFSIANPDGEVIGLAPLYLEGAKAKSFPAVRRLRLVGDGTEDSDNLDLIFRSGYEDECSNALLDRLTSEKGWDVCELNTLGSNSNVAQSMLASLKQRGWPTRQWTRPGSIVRLPDTWEGYLKQLSSEHSGGIKRYTKRLARHYDVRIFKCATEQELTPALEALFDLHQRRWQSQGKPGSFAEPERRNFYYEMSRGFLRQGWLELWVMELNGKPAAAQFAFRRGDTVYQLQEGLDPQHYTDRAGTVLRAHILKQLIAEGVRTYDFLGYVDAHKLSWDAQPGNYIDICFARPFSRGSLHLHMESRARIAKQWFRSRVPEPVLQAIRKIDPRVSA